MHYVHVHVYILYLCQFLEYVSGSGLSTAVDDCHLNRA